MKKGVVNKISKYITIVLLAVLSALSFEIFIVKNNFAPAGMSGVAAMIQHATGISNAYVALAINIPLCIWAFFSTSRKFAIRSMLYILVYSGSYLIIQRLDLSAIQYVAHDGDMVLPCLIGGIISGFTYGMSIKIGSSTGGVDVLAKYVSIKKPMLNFFWIAFVLNAAVALISMFVYPSDQPGILFNYKPICLCVLYSFLSSYMGDKIIKDSRSAAQFTIITTHAEEISEDIIKNIKHSATRIVGHGIYSGKETCVIMCVVNRHQVEDFKAILAKYDHTFSYVSSVNEAIGHFNLAK